jgi:3'(2'), 5'-bisphosphate nucleotidase
MNRLLQNIAVNAVKSAGRQIMTYFKTDIRNEWKYDGSPLTIADCESHKIIFSYLNPTGIPIVSEESDDLHMSEDQYWIIDPLDGTKEFLANNDEFTINIALIENRRPVLGVVYAPALEEIYVGIRQSKVFIERNGIQTEFSQKAANEFLVMAVSRFHNHDLSAIFAAENKILEQIQVGSSLKFVRMLSGEVDVYPRFEGCAEWDTAAGQAILEAAGGEVIDLNTGLPLEYGKENRRNSSFLAYRAPYTLKDFII